MISEQLTRLLVWTSRGFLSVGIVGRHCHRCWETSFTLLSAQVFEFVHSLPNQVGCELIESQFEPLRPNLCTWQLSKRESGLALIQL